MPPSKFIVAGALLSAFLGAPAAQTVTVAMAQGSAAPEAALQMSKTIEDELLVLLFDGGYIVSTEELALKDGDFAKAEFGVKEAAWGMSDYLVAIRARYAADEIKDVDNKVSYARLLGLDWKLVRVANPEVLASGSVDPRVPAPQGTDPYAGVRLLVDGMYPAIDKALGEAKKGGLR